MWCEEDSLLSFVAFLFHLESVRSQEQIESLTEQPCDKNSVVRNPGVLHRFRSTLILLESKPSFFFFLNPHNVLLLSCCCIQKIIRIQCFSEKSGAPCFTNTFFRTLISVNQLSIYGAVADLREEYKACHVRTGRLLVEGQSDPLFVPTTSLMKTPTLSTDDPAQEDLVQKCQERVERLSQQNRVIKFSTDAGFLTTVEIRQYLMTKDTEEF